jgi:hypothetical protein
MQTVQVFSAIVTCRPEQLPMANYAGNCDVYEQTREDDLQHQRWQFEARALLTGLQERQAKRSVWADFYRLGIFLDGTIRVEDIPVIRPALAPCGVEFLALDSAIATLTYLAYGEPAGVCRPEVHPASNA